MSEVKMRDLGLTYDQAAHGVQTAIAYVMENGGTPTTPKHLRVGVDMSKADMMGLATLLISKGVFTPEEYVEHLRLAANEELAMREAAFQGIAFR
jgi:hypothetical protein